MNINDFTSHFPPKLTEAILILGTKDLQEIRIMAEKNCYVQKNGRLLDTGVYITAKELNSIIESMTRGSLYAMQTSLTKGFITLNGGHRVGVCGRAVSENGKVTHITDITALCIRISREVIGASDEIFEFIECGERLYNTLIISPPGGGKTTILRDLARRLGEKYKVCIADERSEIAAMKGNKTGFNVGKLTTVMDSVPKGEGIMMLLRTMAPDVIITDESGSDEEEKAIFEIINCGAKIITSAHGYSEKDVLKRRHLGMLVSDGIFERIIVLSGKKTARVEKIITDGRVMQRV